ncbi:transcriptional regulator ATRX [Leptidea sinapis]|uniref:transcriptional regulator ATRX n=1 Tax=Leptidea sinapis TaxID=189913 RepID=UPI00213804CA|nr:transcriptional regulator ATRX [Leptidea sinapis]
MSETANGEANIAESDEKKPVELQKDVQFPPLPDPTDDDFDEDVPTEEREYYKTKFKDINTISSMKIHCTSCDRHMGCAPKNESRMRAHPMLRTLVCHTCHTFYNSGEFEKGDDGWELYCRWCGQGGQVYCCSNCRHVFCAKCIKRNLGPNKIKEIEDLDDWKCFKCNTQCLWDLRATCWAVLRYCDMKNKIAYKTEDPVKKEAYLKECGVDLSECCKSKGRKKDSRKKEIENAVKKTADSIISKMPPTIQVKKFASMKQEEKVKPEVKKATKRAASPRSKANIIKKTGKHPNEYNLSPAMKKMRMSAPVKVISEKNNYMQTNNLIKIRPKPPAVVYNGANRSFGNMFTNDNINLSLDSLTQGLDMSAMTSTNTVDEEMVCTPDFPIEPLCEVTEDNTDDDVQCITPAPIPQPKASVTTGTGIVKQNIKLSDLSQENIIQMTENDVTVNAATGGLKFRVDPQTLLSNKMYRLPDGRIFAISANPQMPGGYSATIVAVTESQSKPPGTTYAAKLNQVPKLIPTTPPPLRPTSSNRTQPSRQANTRRNVAQTAKTRRSTMNSSKDIDTNVPVEWYRYNLLDSIDALEYSLSRLNKLKKEATTPFLRSRNINQMRALHRSLESVLNTSCHRFNEIKECLQKELKKYILKKDTETQNSEDDDDVEILPNVDDDPIFIDENSGDSCGNEPQEVDLTGPGSSEHNDSSEHLQHIVEPETIICDEINVGNDVLPANDIDTFGDERSGKECVNVGKEDKITKIIDDSTENIDENTGKVDESSISVDEHSEKLEITNEKSDTSMEITDKSTGKADETDSVSGNISKDTSDNSIQIDKQSSEQDEINEDLKSGCQTKLKNEIEQNNEEIATEPDKGNDKDNETQSESVINNSEDKDISVGEKNTDESSSEKREENNGPNVDMWYDDNENDNYDISEKMIEDLLKDNSKVSKDMPSDCMLDTSSDVIG